MEILGSRKTKPLRVTPALMDEVLLIYRAVQFCDLKGPVVDAYMFAALDEAHERDGGVEVSAHEEMAALRRASSTGSAEPPPPPQTRPSHVVKPTWSSAPLSKRLATLVSAPKRTDAASRRTALNPKTLSLPMLILI